MSRTTACGVRLALHRASTRRRAVGRSGDDAMRERGGGGRGRKPTGDARTSFVTFGAVVGDAEVDVDAVVIDSPRSWMRMAYLPTRYPPSECPTSQRGSPDSNRPQSRSIRSNGSRKKSIALDGENSELQNE
jgi:hypothetical protein